MIKSAGATKVAREKINVHCADFDLFPGLIGLHSVRGMQLNAHFSWKVAAAQYHDGTKIVGLSPTCAFIIGRMCVAKDPLKQQHPPAILNPLGDPSFALTTRDRHSGSRIRKGDSHRKVSE